MNNQENHLQRLLIIDDHILFREGLVSLFNTMPDFEVVDEAGTVNEGVEKAFHHKPDIKLMDFSLPDGDGLEATRIILDEMPNCKIIFLTVYETDENLIAALNLGAKGYMLKNVSSNSLISSLRALESGEMAMSRKMMSRALEYSRFGHSAKAADIINKLTPREVDILCEIQEGASNSDIARMFFLSENTIKHHIHSLLEKLSVENRRQAGALARKIGLKRRDKRP